MASTIVMITTKRGNLLSQASDYEFLRNEELDGGTVSLYQNHELHQIEVWWKDNNENWYVKVDDTTYLRAHETSIGWALDEGDRYERRQDGWYRKRD